jgi:hypothetical protein
MRRIKQVKTLTQYRLELVFDDGAQGVVDLSHLVGKGVFAAWRDYGAFEQVRITASGDLEWSDEIDLCADALYLKATGQKPEDIFPALRGETTHA